MTTRLSSPACPTLLVPISTVLYREAGVFYPHARGAKAGTYTPWGDILLADVITWHS